MNTQKQQITKVQKYGGWTNWDTWNANLWLANDEIAYNVACRIINKYNHNGIDLIKGELIWAYSQMQKRLDGFSTDGADIREVNWLEIIQNWN